MQHSPLAAVTAETDWASAARTDFPVPDMSLLDSTRHAPPPFPVQVLQPAWREWAELTAQGAAAPVDYVAGALLATTASLIGNARWLHVWGSWNVPPILWIALVGPPSTGKTPALTPVLKLVRQIERDLLPEYEGRLREHSADVEAAKIRREHWQAQVAKAVDEGRSPPPQPDDADEPQRPERPRLLVSDFNEASLGRVMATQPKGLLAYRDELSGWCLGMDKNGGGEREFYLEAYNGHPHVVDRVKFDGKPLHIDRLSLSVLGGLQPEKLMLAVMAGADDGLSSRFIYIWPDVVPFRRPQALADDSFAAAAFGRLSGLTLSVDDAGTSCPVYVPLAPEAQDILEQYTARNRQDVVSESGLFAGFVGKMPGVAVRLALTLEYLWWSGSNNPEPQVVTATALKAALGLVSDYIIPMGRRSFMDAALPAEVRHGKALARYILKNGVTKLNGRALYRQGTVAGINNASTFRDAAEYLVDAGWLIKRDDRGNGESGRSKSDYQVNPMVHERGAR